MELFRDNPSFFIQVLFFFYPLGATFSRFLFSPFLDDFQLNTFTDHNKFDNDTLITLLSEVSIDALSIDSTGDASNSNFSRGFLNFFPNLFNNVNKSDIWIPYLTVGILMMIGSFLIFAAHFLNVGHLFKIFETDHYNLKLFFFII